MAIALVLGGVIELAENIGWPVTLLGIAALALAVWQMLTAARRPPVVLPPVTIRVAETGPRCMHCGRRATKQSRDRLFTWCDECAGADDVPIGTPLLVAPPWRFGDSAWRQGDGTPPWQPNA